MGCTEKMQKYAKAISEELGVKEPDYNSFEDVSSFITKNKDKYNKLLFNKTVPQRLDYNGKKYKKNKDSVLEKTAPMLNELYAKHGCYVLWSRKEIVYVGKSKNLGARILQSTLEREKQKEITAITPILTQTEADMHILELVLINELKPILNSDTFCKDSSCTFKSGISSKELREKRFLIKDIRSKEKFDFLIFGGKDDT